MPLFNVSTLNVRGLIDSSKRKSIFSYLENEKFDIACLQETHCTEHNENRILRDWKGKSVAGLSNSSYSRGLCILFRKDLDRL